MNNKLKEKNLITIGIICVFIIGAITIIANWGKIVPQQSASENSVPEMDQATISANFANAVTYAANQGAIRVTLNIYGDENTLDENPEQLQAVYDMSLSNAGTGSYYTYSDGSYIEYQYWSLNTDGTFGCKLYDQKHGVWVQCNIQEPPITFNIAEQLSDYSIYTYQGEEEWQIDAEHPVLCDIYGTSGSSSYYDEIKQVIYIEKATGALVGIITIGDKQSITNTENVDMDALASVSEDDAAFQEYLDANGVELINGRTVVMYSVSYKDTAEALFNVPDVALTEDEWITLYGDDAGITNGTPSGDSATPAE